MWRMHPEPDSKLYAKGPHWRICDDTDCPLQHVEYEPFRPIIGQEIDLSYLAPTKYKGRNVTVTEGMQGEP